jgi:6,7-dimethyl-8-ribityllumazine synthase
MGTTNLSSYDQGTVPDASDMRFGIVVSDWNNDITWALLDGAVRTLKLHGTDDDNIVI